MVRSALIAAAAALFAISTAWAHPGHEERDQPPWQAPTGWPDRIITTLADVPQTSFSVNWRTDINVAESVAEIAPASSDTRFDLNAVTVAGITIPLHPESVQSSQGTVFSEIHNTGLPTVNYHSVTFTGLEPDTLYAYRVRGEKGKWSAWRQLRTAPVDGPVSFIFFGDAQNGIRSHVTRIFDIANQIAPYARFAIHGGDLVNTAMYDREWAEWFVSMGNTHLVKPAILVAGNHDYVNFSLLNDDPSDDKLFIADKTVTPYWRPQFTLPVVTDLPEDLAETVYEVRYTKDLDIFVLDSSGVAWDKQLDWLEKGLRTSDAKWKIVTMHHPIFSFVGGTEQPSARARREALQKVMSRNDIDLVLTGHRHTYQRGIIGDDVARFAVGDPQDVDTVFVITASTVKRGDTKVSGWDRFTEQEKGDIKLTKYANNTPIFAVFDISGDTLSYRAIDGVGELYDAFTLTKTASGTKTLENAPIAGEPAKDLENTGRYIGWDDLR